MFYRRWSAQIVPRKGIQRNFHNFATFIIECWLICRYYIIERRVTCAWKTAKGLLHILYYTSTAELQVCFSHVKAMCNTKHKGYLLLFGLFSPLLYSYVYFAYIYIYIIYIIICLGKLLWNLSEMISEIA